jgi:hypothetical protein
VQRRRRAGRRLAWSPGHAPLRFVGLLSSILTVAACTTLQAAPVEEPQAAVDKPMSPAEEAPAARRSYGKWIGQRGQYDPRPYDRTLIGDGLLGRAYFERKNRTWVEDGLAVGGYLSSGSQWGSEGGLSHHMGEGLLLATWEPVRGPASAGRVVAGFAYDQLLGGPTTRAFADGQGLVETPNDLDTDPDETFATLGLLHWTQDVYAGPESGWTLRAGQLYGPSYFGVGIYLDDDRRFFMARPLATAAGAQWVGFNDIGLGVTLTRWSGPLHVTLGAMDGKANRKYPDFGSLLDGQLLYLAEVGYEHDLEGPDETALRLTFSHLDVEDGDAPQRGPGQSLMVSGVKTFDGSWALAVRWSKSFERLSADYRDLISLGLLLLEPTQRENDILGVGAFLADPSDESFGAEYGGEVFYRLQLTQAMNLMPDLQYWSNDRTDDGSSEGKWIIGFRLNFEF